MTASLPLPAEFVSFPTRDSRSRFVATRFAKYLVNSTLLDVGCFEAPLRELLPSCTYTGVDIAGRPDIVLNLEKTARLPFEDGQFDIVLCIEVLEHLDNLHTVFSEIVRVARKYTLVSLPNCWCDARRPIEKGRGHFGHYGLPSQKPLDRHKWFFDLSEAREFMQKKAEELGLHVEEMFVTEKPRNAAVNFFRKIRYRGADFQNRYSGTLWTLLRKEP
jgi:SAM-dependent methyltransferase